MVSVVSSIRLIYIKFYCVNDVILRCYRHLELTSTRNFEELGNLFCYIYEKVNLYTENGFADWAIKMTIINYSFVSERKELMERLQQTQIMLDVLRLLQPKKRKMT